MLGFDRRVCVAGLFEIYSKCLEYACVSDAEDEIKILECCKNIVDVAIWKDPSGLTEAEIGRRNNLCGYNKYDL